LPPRRPFRKTLAAGRLAVALADHVRRVLVIGILVRRRAVLQSWIGVLLCPLFLAALLVVLFSGPFSWRAPRRRTDGKTVLFRGPDDDDHLFDRLSVDALEYFGFDATTQLHCILSRMKRQR